MPKYDLAISFAGEQRDLARSLAERLDAAGYSIFYDGFHRAALWGEDLTIALSKIYAEEARWCLIIVSKEYVEKRWTNFERQNALHRFVSDRSGYILCLNVDDSQLPGFPAIVGRMSLRNHSVDEVYGLLLQKLGKPAHDDFIPRVSDPDRELARDVIAACYRRAVFARMESELSVQAMTESLGNALAILQRLTPRIDNPALQFAVTRIVGELDSIQRIAAGHDARMAFGLPAAAKNDIDERKQNIIRLLLEIRRAAAITIQLPNALRTDHFWNLDDANKEPSADF